MAKLERLIPGFWKALFLPEQKCNILSLKHVPTLVKKDLKIIAFTLFIERQVKVKVPLRGYHLIHLISRMKEWNVCGNVWIVFHAENLRSSRQAGRFRFIFTNLISMNYACSDKIDLKINIVKGRKPQNSKTAMKMGRWVMISLFHVFKLV